MVAGVTNGASDRHWPPSTRCLSSVDLQSSPATARATTELKPRRTFFNAEDTTWPKIFSIDFIQPVSLCLAFGLVWMSRLLQFAQGINWLTSDFNFILAKVPLWIWVVTCTWTIISSFLSVSPVISTLRIKKSFLFTLTKSLILSDAYLVCIIRIVFPIKFPCLIFLPN